METPRLVKGGNCPFGAGEPLKCNTCNILRSRGRGNAVAGIIGQLFGHMEAFEIVMFNNLGVRFRLVGACNVAKSVCFIHNQVLECDFACVMFT